MADLEKTVKIIFSGEDTLSQTINDMERGLNSLGANVTSATQPLADFTTSILAVDAALALLAAGALTAATIAAGQFGDSFNEITTLISAPADSIDSFRQDIINYARDSTQSFEDINSAIYNAISSGQDYATALDFITQAEQLAIATKADLNQSVNVLRPTMNAFGAATDEAADYADILFTTVRTGKTTLDELEPVLANVTGIAASGGIPFADLSASIAGLTAAGAPTAQAVTQIRSALVAILAPTDSAREAAEQLHVQLGAEAVAAHGLDGVFRQLYDATGGNLEQMRLLIPRIEGANAAIILGQDASGGYANSLDAMANRAGAATVAYGLMADNFSLTNQRLINNLRATLIDVGTPLLDDWADIARGLGQIFEGVSIGIADGAFDPIFEIVQNFGQAIAADLAGIAAAMPEALSQIDWSGIVTAFQTLGTAATNVFSNVFGDLDLTDADDLATAIQAIISGIEALINTTAGIVTGLGPFFEGLAEIADKMLDVEGNTFETIGQIAGLGTGINLIAQQIPNITGTLNIFSGAIGLLSLTRLPGLITLLSGAGGLVSSFAALAGPVIAVTALFAALQGDSGLGGWLRDNSTLFNSFGQAIDNTLLKFSDYDMAAINLRQRQGEANVELGHAIVALHDMGTELDDLPDQTPVNVFWDNLGQFVVDGETVHFIIDGIPATKTIEIAIDSDDAVVQANQAWNTIYTTIDGQEIAIPVKTTTDAGNLEDSKQKIEAATPSERITIARIEGDISIELAQIEAQAEVLQTAFEWQARLDIAEVEAGAQRLETVATLIGESFQSTGEVLGAIVGALADASGYNALVIREALEQESRRRDELLVLQRDLTQAEIDLTRARTTRLESGGGLITIEASGVYPELELVLQSIIERAQIQANSEGIAFLLGA